MATGLWDRDVGGVEVEMRIALFLSVLVGCPTTVEPIPELEPTPAPPTPAPDFDVTIPVTEGLCEASGFCWEVPGGLGIRLHDATPTSRDTVWMRGEYRSVVRWQNGTWLRARLDSDIADLDARSDDEAWAVADGGVYRIDADGATRFDVEPGYGQNIATDGAGTLWIAGPSGVLEGDGSTWVSLDGWPGALRWLDGELWSGDYGYAYRYDGAGWESFFGSDDTIDDLVRGPDGPVYLGSYTRGEIYVLDDVVGNFVAVPGSEGLGSDLAVDASGVWASTGDVATHLSPDGQVRSVQLPRSMESLASVDGVVFGVGSPGAVVRIEDGVPTDLNPGLDIGTVHQIVGESVEDLWVAADHALLHRSGEEWGTVDIGDAARGVAVHQGVVHVATWDGLVTLDGPVSRTTPLPETFWGGRAVGVDRDGTVFVGTSEGMLRLDDDVLVDAEATSRFVMDFAVGDAGFFAHTGRRGILMRTDDGWDTIQLPFGLESAAIAVTDRLWVLCGGPNATPRLLTWDGSSWTPVAGMDFDAMPSPARLAVHGDTIWVAATNGRQLARLEAGELTVFGQETDVRSVWVGPDGAAYGSFYGGIAIR